MKIPHAMNTVSLKMIPPQMGAMLSYLIDAVHDDAKEESISYDFANDELTYHRVVSEFDKGIFHHLDNIQEIWIVLNARAHS